MRLFDLIWLVGAYSVGLNLQGCVKSPSSPIDVSDIERLSDAVVDADLPSGGCLRPGPCVRSSSDGTNATLYAYEQLRVVERRVESGDGIDPLIVRFEYEQGLLSRAVDGDRITDYQYRDGRLQTSVTTMTRTGGLLWRTDYMFDSAKRLSAWSRRDSVETLVGAGQAFYTNSTDLFPSSIELDSDGDGSVDWTETLERDEYGNLECSSLVGPSKWKSSFDYQCWGREDCVECVIDDCYQMLLGIAL